MDDHVVHIFVLHFFLPFFTLFLIYLFPSFSLRKCELFYFNPFPPLSFPYTLLTFMSFLLF
jgi:hypothetical protein